MPITRSQIVTSYTDFFKSKESEPQCLFALTMVWGFGYSGYGPFRTMQYINSPENINHINSAFNYITDDKIKAAFDELNEIHGLGISFLSKVLHFASKGRGHKQYPLIFDIRVAKALIKLHSPNIAKMVQINPKNEWEAYSEFNTMIHDWAKKYDVSADLIELFLFDLDKNELGL